MLSRYRDKGVDDKRLNAKRRGWGALIAAISRLDSVRFDASALFFSVKTTTAKRCETLHLYSCKALVFVELCKSFRAAG